MSDAITRKAYPIPRDMSERWGNIIENLRTDKSSMWHLLPTAAEKAKAEWEKENG